MPNNVVIRGFNATWKVIGRGLSRRNRVGITVCMQVFDEPFICMSVFNNQFICMKVKTK